MHTLSEWYGEDGSMGLVHFAAATTAAPANRRGGAVAAAAAATLAAGEPAIKPGPKYSDPFACSFDSYCRRHLPMPPQWSVTLLPGVGGKALARAMMEAGIGDLLAVAPETIIAALLQRTHAATLSGTAWHDAAAIREETAAGPTLAMVVATERLIDGSPLEAR